MGRHNRLTISSISRDCWVEWFASATLSFLIVFSPLIDGGTTQLPVLTIRLILLASICLWVIQQMRGGALWVLKNSISPPVVLFLVWAALSHVWSAYKSASSHWFLTLLSYGILLVLVSQYAQTKKSRWWIVAFLLGMGVIEGVLGIIQYVWLGEARAKGTFFNPNFFASYEAAILALSLGIVVCKSSSENCRFPSILLGGVALVTGIAFVMAQSRGAFVAFVVVLCLLGVFRFGNVAGAVLLAILVLGALVPNPLRGRIVEAGSQDPFAYTRLDIWKSSLERFAQHPLGIGLGMYKYGSFQDRFPSGDHIVKYKKRPESAHNEYLQMGVELGVVGLFIFLTGMRVLLREVWLTWRMQRGSSEEGLILGLLGAVLVLVVHAGGDSVFHEPALLVVLIVAGGVLHNLFRESYPDTLRWVQIPFPYGRTRVGLVLGCGLALAVLCVQPAAAWYVHELGRHEAGQGRVASALERYIEATRIDPGTTGYHDSVARTALLLFEESKDAKWLEMASEEESIARDLNRLDGRFPYRLGTIYTLMAKQTALEQQRVELLNKAARAYAEAIQADPYTPFSYYELAKLLLLQGRRREALELLTTAKNYEPNYLPGRALLAETAVKAGLPGDYQREFSEIKAIAAKFEGQARDGTERQFVEVDLYPLGRALAVGGTG